MVDELRQAGFELESTVVDNEADYLAQLDPAVDIIISDYSLPQWDAPSALRALQALDLDIPFIMVSGTVGEEKAVECMKQGAADYLLKDRLARLGQAVTKALEDQRLRQENRQVQAAMRASELRYRRLFEAAQDGILILDAGTGKIIDVNPYLVNRLGYTHDEFISKYLWEIGAFHDLVASQDAFKQLVETGYTRYDDLPLQTSDGRIIPVEFVSNLYLANGITVIQCNIRDISERKRAEEQIKSLAKFPSENPNPILRISTDGMVLFTNNSGRALLADLGSAVGEPVPAGWHHVITNIMTRASDMIFEFRHRDKIWAFYIAPIQGEGYFNLYGTDITERKHIEEALAQERNLLDLVINNIPDFIYAKDREGRYLLRNAQWSHSMGLASTEEAVGKTDFDYYSPEVAARYAADDQQVIESGQALIDYEETTTDADGSTRWLLTTKVPLRDPLGSVTGIVGVGHDITERKQAQEAITFQAKLLNTVAESVIATDLDGTITYWNHFAETLYGWSAEEIIGSNIIDLAPTNRSRKLAQRILTRLQSGKNWSGELMVLNRSGVTFPALVMSTPIIDESGVQIGMIGVSIDITERKQTELRLAKLNRILAVLSDVNQAIVRIRVASELYDRVCRIAVDLGSFHMAWIGLLDPETRQVNPVAAAGITTDYLEKLNISLDDETRGRGPTATAIRTGEAIIANDIGHDDRMAPWRTDALQLGYRASASFPLRVGDEIRGVLNLYADKPDFFDEQEIQLLNEMAADISFAMEFAEQEAQRTKAEQELKLHAQAVEEMHLFLQTTLDAFPAHTAVLDPDGVIINTNAAWEQFAIENGANSATYYLGANYLTVCDTAVGLWSDEAPAVAAGIRTVIAGKRDDFYLEYACHSPTEKRWFMLRVTPFPEPAPRRVVVAHVNVTERRLAENAIRALNTELEARVIERTAQYVSAMKRVEGILNSSSDPIILCRIDETIIQANRASHELLDSNADNDSESAADRAADRHLSSLIIPEHVSSAEQAFQAVLDSKQLQRIDITIRRSDGSTFDADMMLSPVISEDDILSGVVCALHDITERKRMQDDLRIALEKERELGELKTRFVSIVSHEFRNPLASILSAADLMANYSDRMSEARKVQHLSAIQQQVQHLTELMNDILLIGKADNVGFAFSPAPLDLTAFCQTCIKQVQETTGASHTLLLSANECSSVRADEKLLRHILLNLLTNAVKYSPVGSKVYIGLHCEADQATLYVRDEGIGIPEDDQVHLFEAFHRAGNVGLVAGTGLGLAITKRAVEAHNGTISFESVEGLGTTFTVTFPIR